MRVNSIINLKGGVAKTISSVSMAYILSQIYNYRVLLIDNDKQGNTTKLFNLHDDEKMSIADVMTDRNIDIENVIAPTQYNNLDVIPANMKLLNANREVLLDSSRIQQFILKNALEQIEDDYDFCIIDNPPDINISVMNALVSSDDVMIPVKIDKFTFDGVDTLLERINEAKQINPKLKVQGCFVTQYSNNRVNKQGEEVLNTQNKYPIFKSHIRRTVKADESTFWNKPLVEYSKNCTASKDYLSLVEEYLGKLEE